MPVRCDTCGAAQSTATPVHALAEIGFGEGHQDQQIHICQGCLDLREAKRWDQGNPEALRLLDALAGREQPPPGRYSYLSTPGGPVHLMRLRPDWVDQHAQARA